MNLYKVIITPDLLGPKDTEPILLFTIEDNIFIEYLVSLNESIKHQDMYPFTNRYITIIDSIHCGFDIKWLWVPDALDVVNETYIHDSDISNFYLFIRNNFYLMNDLSYYDIKYQLDYLIDYIDLIQQLKINNPNHIIYLNRIK